MNRSTNNTTANFVDAIAADPDLIISDSQVTLLRENRRYRIRGLEKNTSVCMLKVNIMASRDDLVHLDTIDLVKARSRASFIKARCIPEHIPPGMSD